MYSNLFNFRSIGCVTCSWALSWRRTGPFLLTNTGCRHCSFQCLSLITWAYLSDVMVSPGLRKPYWIRLAVGYQTVAMTLFGASLALGSALELLLDSTTELVVTSCCIQPIFFFFFATSNEYFTCHLCFFF